MKYSRIQFFRTLATTLKTWLLRFFTFMGFVFVCLIVLSFTRIPYDAYFALGTRLISNTLEEPDAIVLLGAGGMPGSESLVRVYYAKQAVQEHPSSRVLVALPADTTDFLNSDHYRMAHALVEDGMDSLRLVSDVHGTNTREQAMNAFNLLGRQDMRILIVTSPEHMYRAILTFRKAGFSKVNGLPAFENAFEEELLITPGEKGKAVKRLDQNTSLRYNMWSYLQYEIKVLRELAALMYYKLAGYI